MRLFLLLFETIFVISVLDWNQLAMEAYSGENHHQKDKQHLYLKRLATLASVASQFQSNTENTNMAIRKGSISDVELPKCTLEAHFPLILRKFRLFMLTKLLHLSFTLVSRLRIKTSKTNRIISRVVSFQFFFF